MLHVIRRKLNKTPIQNSSTLLRQIDDISSENLSPLLASTLLGEGVYGFEVVSNSDFIESYLFTPAIFRENIGKEVYREFDWLQDEIRNAHCYDITLNKPSFLPIYIQKEYSLLHNLILLRPKHSEMFIQFLFTERNDAWQEDMIQQYEEYLQGNDFPSTSRLGRKFQQKALKIINKVGGFDLKRGKIDEIEQKILENGYRFELRMVVIDRKLDVIKFEVELKEVLKEVDYFNELTYSRMRDKKIFIQDIIGRKFSSESVFQTLSESELVSILSDDIEMTNKSKEELEPQISMNQSFKNDSMKLFNLLPIGKKKNRELDNEIVSGLPSALKKAKAIKTEKIEIVNVELGATVQSITFKIPNGHVYSDIKGKYEDIRSTLGHESLSIIQGKEPNTVTFLIPCSHREIIYLKELIGNPDFIKFAEENPLPFICGIDMLNEPVYKCLTKAPHVLICGGTNSGKSTFTNALLITLILLRTPQELRLILIDPKKVEFGIYEGIAHVEEVVTDMEKAMQSLEKLVNEMEKRYDKMAKQGVKNIAAYNRQSKTKMPYIVVAIDEYNDLKMVYPDVEDYVKRLGQKARASGIHMIICTQTPNKDVIDNTIKTNLPSRISLKLDNNNEYKIVFGTGIPYRNLLGFGDGVVKYVGQTEEFIRFQAPVITLDEMEEEKTFDNIKKAFKGEKVESIELEEVEQPLDKMKRIIATTMDTRTEHLQQQMGIRINDVVDLRKQLVDEGFLEKVGMRFEVSASEEELLKWRTVDVKYIRHDD